MNVKYYGFFVEIHVSGVAPCVNPSKNSCRALMESTFDEVGLLLKIYSDGCINYYLKTIWACPEVKSGTSRTLSENRATRPTGQIFFLYCLGAASPTSFINRVFHVPSKKHLTLASCLCLSPFARLFSCLHPKSQY